MSRSTYACNSVLSVYFGMKIGSISSTECLGEPQALSCLHDKPQHLRSVFKVWHFGHAKCRVQALLREPCNYRLTRAESQEDASCCLFPVQVSLAESQGFRVFQEQGAELLLNTSPIAGDWYSQTVKIAYEHNSFTATEFVFSISVTDVSIFQRTCRFQIVCVYFVSLFFQKAAKKNSQ